MEAEAAPATQNPVLSEIRPPRIEDAGLEDCALPPDSIREAFLKAAASVGSRIISDDEEEECDLVDDIRDPLFVSGDSVASGGRNAVLLPETENGAKPRNE